MKQETRWIIITGLALLTISLALYTAHFYIFQDAHHVLIFLMGDIAFIPIEVLIVTLIIDQLLEARERENRVEKLNMIIGTFFSSFGTSLLASLTNMDPDIASVRETMIIGDDWKPEQFAGVKACLGDHACRISGDGLDLVSLKETLLSREDFIIRLVENPMIFEHESFTDLILAIHHLTEELKARKDLRNLPPADLAHLCGDIRRVYERLVPSWLHYMEYLKKNYPYLFSLAMRTNPYDEQASVTITS